MIREYLSKSSRLIRSWEDSLQREEKDVFRTLEQVLLEDVSQILKKHKKNLEKQYAMPNNVQVKLNRVYSVK